MSTAQAIVRAAWLIAWALLHMGTNQLYPPHEFDWCNDGTQGGDG